MNLLLSYFEPSSPIMGKLELSASGILGSVGVRDSYCFLASAIIPDKVSLTNGFRFHVSVLFSYPIS